MFLLVVADVEREGDNLRGDFGREARKNLRGKFRGERLPVGLLICPVPLTVRGCDLAIS